MSLDAISLHSSCRKKRKKKKKKRKAVLRRVVFLVATLGDESKVTGFSRSSLLQKTKKNKIGVSWCKNKRKCLKLFDLAQAWGGWAGVLPMATDVEVRGMVR